MRNTILPYRPDLRQKARDLRKNSTSSEVFLWIEIKNRSLGVQFHRQVPMLDYIVDFYCHELMLAIEVDGDSHAHADAVKYDARRQARLEAKGVRFLRIDDLDVKREMPYVLNEILNTVNKLKNEK